MLQYSANADERAGEENIRTTEQLQNTEKERKELEKNKRQVPAAMETPEETAARSAKRIEYLRKKKEQTSPEELAMAAERAKARRALREAMETPEQYAIRRSKAAERERKRRLRLAKERLEAGEEKPLEEKDKIKKEMELRKRREKFRASKEKETPEQAAARRAKANERQKRRREQVQTRKEESPEQAAARRAKKAEYERKRRKEQSLRDRLNGVKRPKRIRKRETRKQAAERRARIAEMKKMECDKHIFLQNATDELSTEISMVKPDGVDVDINESCTKSSFGPSEGSFSVTTTEGSYSISTTKGNYSITTADEIPSNQHEPEETIIVKNEPSDDLLSFAGDSKLSFVIQEVFEDNKEFASAKDESVDREYKPSTSYQGLQEKYIKTDVGFGPEYVENKTETNVVIGPILQDIIIKEEVDL